jgi:hypothetical protein
MVYNLDFFNLQNAICFIIVTCLLPVLFTFYIQGVPKLKKNNSGAKRLNAKINPVCHLLTLLGPQHILHVSRVSVNMHFLQLGKPFRM